MRLSIHMMVLNGAKVIERALRPFATIADEVVVVDTGSTDGTPGFVQHLCDIKFPDEFGEKAKLKCHVAALISPKTSPKLYFRDSPSSWQMEMPGPFTGQPMLADWATARNMGVSRCQGDYIIKLDADDEILDPTNILPALKFLDDHPRSTSCTVPTRFAKLSEKEFHPIQPIQRWRQSACTIGFGGTDSFHTSGTPRKSTNTSWARESIYAAGLTGSPWRRA